MFDRLKGILGRSTSSSLETFIRAVDAKLAEGKAPSVEKQTDELSQAFSLVSLTVAGRLHGCIAELSKAMPKGLKRSAGPSYDLVTFEAAAYCHYFTMKEYLRLDEDDDQSEDSYFGCLRRSTFLTAALLKSYVDFQLPAEEFFSNRAVSYGLPGRSVRQDAERLGQLILASKDGRPATQIKTQIDLEDFLPIVLNPAIAVWHASHLEAMVESFHRVYEHFGQP